MRQKHYSYVFLNKYQPPFYIASPPSDICMELIMDNSFHYFEKIAPLLLAPAKDIRSLEDIDWQALRQSYTQWLKSNGGLFEIVEHEGLADMVGLCDIKNAFEAYNSSTEQNEEDFYSFVTEKLLDAIMDSGTGESEDSAIYVVNVFEEYFLLNNVFSCKKTKSQQLVGYKEKSIDIIEFEDVQGKARKIFFDVTDALAAE